MITNDDGFRQTLEQLHRAYEALAVLRQEVQPVSPPWYGLMAEGPVDQIRQLQHEVEAYLSLQTAEQEMADLWLSIRGRGIEAGNAPTSVLTALLDALRKGVQAVAEFVETGQLTTRPTAALKRACDLKVVALQAGSLQVGLRIPASESLPTDGPAPVERAIRDYLEVAAWVGSNTDLEKLDHRFPDAQKRRLILNALKPFVPRPRGAVDTVTISGRQVPTRQPIVLTRQVYQRIDAAIDKTTTETVETHTGFLREIDLDNLSFILRNTDDIRETHCTFEDDLLETAKEGLDRQVKVTGVRKTGAGRRPIAVLRVMRLEIVEE